MGHCFYLLARHISSDWGLHWRDLELRVTASKIKEKDDEVKGSPGTGEILSGMAEIHEGGFDNCIVLPTMIRKEAADKVEV